MVYKVGSAELRKNACGYSLIEKVSSTAISAGAPQEKYVYAYDHKGRKVSATKYTYKNNDWQLSYINTRYYDDHNIIYETTDYYKLSENNQLSLEITKTNKYYYGEDLLGELYGTGGTGGLRMLEIDGIEAYAFESMNGNIEALYSVTVSGNESTPETEVLPKLLADYEYEPFGQLRKQSGALAETNPLRFSTRYTEPNTNLRYYIYRHYSPKLSKWLSKDPIAEDGGRNLYQMVINDSINYIDLLGLEKACCGEGSKAKKYDTQTQCCNDGNVINKRECTTVIAIGHASSYNEFKNNARPKPGDRLEILSCFSQIVNAQAAIDFPENTWSDPYRSAGLVYPIYNDPRINRDNGDESLLESYIRALSAAEKEAKKQCSLSKNCCKKVTILLYAMDKDGKAWLGAKLVKQREIICDGN